MTTATAGFRLVPAESSLLVIDVQEKLLPAIPQTPRLLLNTTFLLDIAKLYDVPVCVTEQYPQGLGPTAAALAAKLPTHRPAKQAFSSCAVPEVVAELQAGGRPAVLVVGIETHVCVLNTVLDLLDMKFRVAVVADAVAGRFALDHDLALRRMERAGALLTTVETVAFEWTASAAAPQFKTVSKLVQQRSTQLAGIAS